MPCDASLLGTADGSAVEVRIVGYRSGGNPTKRRTVEVGAVEWNVDYGGTPGSELYYLRARYYDPETGRFLGQDPLRGEVSSPGTMNRYVYVTNNPTLFVDPYGYWGLKDIAKGAKKVGGGIVKGAKAAGQAVLSVGDCATEYRCSQRWSYHLDWWAAQLQNAAAVTTNVFTVGGCIAGAAVSAGVLTGPGCLLGKGIGEWFTQPIQQLSNLASVGATIFDCVGRFADDKEGGGFTWKNVGKCATTAVVTVGGFVPEANLNAAFANYQLYCRDEDRCGKWLSW